VNVPDVWKGERNPVKYAASLEEIGIDPSKVEWKPMPPATIDPTDASVLQTGAALMNRGHSEEGSESNGNGWKCAGGGVLLEGLQRCFHLFISHKHHLLNI